MERLPVTYAALALAFGLLAFGLWTAVARLLRKPPSDLTSMERAIGYLMLGRFFGPLHTRLHARGERLTPLKGLGLALTIVIAVAAGIALFVYSRAAAAQQELPPNGLLLVAKPSLVDRNFTRSVVLVTQAPDYSTVGVILNRPTSVRYQGKPIWAGGPVMRQVVVALFRSEQAPENAAFHVLKNVYLSMHPQIVDALIADGKARYRLYSGFSGWAPRQLESEFGRDGWYVLPADEATIFREDMGGLWEELLARAAKPKA